MKYIQNETYNEKIVLFPQNEVAIESVRYELREKPTTADKFDKGKCFSRSVYKQDLEKINDLEFKLNSFQLDYCCGDYIEEYWVKFVNGSQISIIQRQIKLKPAFSELDKFEPQGPSPYNTIVPKVTTRDIDGNVITITEDSDVMEVVFQNVGIPGSDGFSPTVVVKTQTSTEYVLEITDVNGTFDTPNLQGQNGSGGSDLMVSITHADLLALVNSSSLTKGQQYRITDYVATVDESVYNPDNVGFFARSNNHAFDIIVVADSENKLNESSRAIRHEGDTYFPSNTKFETWQLKYTIFNDSERFDWALSSGKGVIYQLIDEWNNDVSYDFKSIQFQRDDVWVYTFGGGSDASLEKQNCSENVMKPCYTFINDFGYGLNNNTFGIYNTFNDISFYCYSNTFEDECYSNKLNNSCVGNYFGNNCNSNTFGSGCSSNTFGYSFISNTIGAYCYSNIFGYDCSSNTIGAYCYSNTFGNECHSNTIGMYCDSNTFGNNKVNYQVSGNVRNINVNTQLSNFTTMPNGNLVRVYKTVNTIAFWQEVSAGVFETFDVV